MPNKTTLIFPIIGNTTLSAQAANRTVVNSAVVGPVGPQGTKGDTGDSNYLVEEFTLSSLNVANGYIDLLHIPANTIYIDMVGGVRQYETIDFSVSANRIGWIGLGMEPLVSNGQKISVQYWI